MKRFDKGYIYSSLISDLFASILIFFALIGDLISDEEAPEGDFLSALPFFIIGFVLIYLAFIAYRVIYYRTSGYELTESEIKCKRGVLFRKRSVLDYKRIHAINKKQSIFNRIFGIAVLTVDSGSTNTAHQAEITIIEKAATVDALMDRLNALKSGETESVCEEKEEILLSENDSLYNFTSGKKMLYTLINIASTAFFTAIFAVLAITVIGALKLLLSIDGLGTWGEYFLYSLIITAGAMLLFSVFSFIGCMIHSFVGYYDFTVTKKGNDIQISYGLINRHTNTFSYDRIKAVKISEGLVQRMLGFATIKLEVIGYTASGDDDNGADIGVLVPFCKRDEVEEILEKILPDFIPDKKETCAASYFPFISWFALILGTVSGVLLSVTCSILKIAGVSAFVIATVAISLIGVALLLLLVKAIGSALSYRQSGIAVSGDKITAYYGGYTKYTTVFMKKNLIAAENNTTPLRKRAGIASLIMHLKTNATSNEITVHMQEDRLVRKIEDLLIL